LVEGHKEDRIREYRLLVVVEYRRRHRHHLGHLQLLPELLVVGFGEERAHLMPALKMTVRPELWSRLVLLKTYQALEASSFQMMVVVLPRQLHYCNFRNL
jgi:hypothetical protein